MSTFAIGDIHGGYRSLLQCLEKSNFNKEEDILVVLGDVSDGWPETSQCIDELLTIKNLIPLLGNHDYWLRNYVDFGWTPELWAKQGGEATLMSYLKRDDIAEVISKHRLLYFPKTHFYYIDHNKNAYVHAGYTSKEGLGYDSQDTYMWDRTLWDKAKSAHSTGALKMSKMYNKVFIGHTSLGRNTLPTKKCNVWNLDTGGGWEGSLTIMNVDTEEFWQSDKVSELYPEVKGRL